MRRCIIAMVVVGVVPVVEAAPARVSWGDLVGAYQGRLAWKNCNTPGVERATIAVDAMDGALEIDLTAAAGGLRAFSLAPESTTAWTAQQGDVRVRIARTRADQLALHVTIDETCEVRATLTRKTVGIPACDRLLGWSRIEQWCTKRTEAPLEDREALLFERSVWTKQKQAAAAVCAARADTLATAMIDAGCAPADDPAAVQLGATCLSLAQASVRVQRCTTAPPELVEVSHHLGGLAVPGPDAASRVIAEQQCADGLELLARLAQQARCPL
ncbi:MAG: hypothetical protein SFX73_07345 [Kofleriaceae bacterium]|nr:hypothetical protein [Kofleriaceae bacterium]